MGNRHVQVRPARPVDYAAIGALTVSAYVGDGLVAADYEKELADVSGRASEAELLVAEVDGDIVGGVAFARPETPFAEITAGPEEAAFRMLAVSSVARRQGVGEALVRACLARGREYGATRMVISSGKWMVAAHRLYEQLGFHRDPDRDWSPRPGVELLCYILPLDGRVD